MIKRTASAVWNGDLKGGKGNIKLAGGAFDGQYSNNSRFENGTGTNPEELVAAAHSGCFSMALAHGLSEAGFVPNSVNTTATVTLEFLEGGPTVTGIQLDCNADVPNISAEQFNEIANATKSGCPISRLLSSVPITLNAQLASGAGA
jgi:lipoyl-dependent peroxiredoxin